MVPLLEKSASHFGEVFPVEGVARRAMRVPVADPDIRARFGIDHYYEIDLFLPLAGAALRFGKDASGEKNPVYRNAFPATLIVRELPEGLAESENMHELVRADAVFFKVWAYRSNYTSQFGQLQPAPLFLAARPTLVHVQPPAHWLIGTLVLSALGLALGVAGIVAWWYRQSDRAAQAQAKSCRHQEPTPDFSGLKE